MEIFGVGPLEVILVLILALVVLGPQDMVATAYKIGAWIRKIVRSPMWREVMETSREIRQIPTTLIRDSGIEEAMAEVKDTGQMVKNEVGQATQEVSSEMQQANAELDAAAAEAQIAPGGMPPLSPEIPPVQPWVEESGNQPAPPMPADYPQTIPLGVAEPPEAVTPPPEVDSSTSARSAEYAADPPPPAESA